MSVSFRNVISPLKFCSHYTEFDGLYLLSCFTRHLNWERSAESPAAAGASDLFPGGAHEDGRGNEDCVDKDLDQSASIQGVVHG